MDTKDLIENLAALEHNSWARWMDYLFSKCTPYEGGMWIPPELVERWKRQAATTYAGLSEQEKQSDRNEVAYVMPVIDAYVADMIDKMHALSIDRQMFKARSEAQASQMIDLKHEITELELALVEARKRTNKT